MKVTHGSLIILLSLLTGLKSEKVCFSQEIKPFNFKVNFQVGVNDNFKRDTCTFSHFAFTSCLDTVFNLPLWVSHTITKEIIEKGEVRRKRPKNPDYSADPLYPSIKNDAYASSGYDHGHMAPARDFKWSKTAWNESFMMTNMSPQHACLNQKVWCHLEAHCRKWVSEYPDIIMYIVTGCLTDSFIDTLCISNKLTVYVPEKFYKVIVTLDTITSEVRGVGFILNNEDTDNSELGDFNTTIDNVEELTGMDFFSFLPDSAETEAEGKIADFIIEKNKLDCPNKKCSKIYFGRRKTPHERKKLHCY